jgi:hypothetical protein
MILTYTYGGINRSFSGRLRLSVMFDYPANGNRSLAQIIEVLLYNIISNYLTAVKHQVRTASGDTNHIPTYLIPVLQKAVRNITDRSYVGDVTN